MRLYRFKLIGPLKRDQSDRGIEFLGAVKVFFKVRESSI